ncbi:hypothetical protein GMST_10470 [Geomonas silvestris]|uniref:Uncharacterized protein n=1 Tax=Geomonas silvestris TaxID=2740184 RepID=A0A6V8MFK5_9BACT|nr:hypothetical protein [Geomonas silvestris]GFO58722.1 hypothetical protein GMST_10470 [Geomonas silvestris]
MPAVLVLSRGERLLRLVRPLVQPNLLRLHTAATLGEAREVLAEQQPEWVLADLASLPDYGAAEITAALSGPATSVVLLATGHEAIAPGTPSRADLVLDLALSDAELVHALRSLICSGSTAEQPQPAPAHPLAQARALLFTTPDQQAERPHLWAALGSAAVFGTALVFWAVAGRRGPEAVPSRAVPAAPPVASSAPSPVPTPLPAPAPRPLPAPAQARRPAAGRSVNYSQPARNEPTDPAAPEGVPPGSVVVGPNETVLRILKRDFGLGYHEALALLPALRRLNKGRDLDRLQPGQRLELPPELLTGAAPEAPAPSGGSE